MLAYDFRPTRLEDAEAMAGLVNACSNVLFGRDEDTAESILADWRFSGVCLETHSRVIALPDGRIIATAELWDLQEDHLQMYGYWRLHPEYTDLGFEDLLAAWIEERARSGLDQALPGARVALIIRAVDLDRVTARTLIRRGYRIVRSLARMEADLGELPAGDGALPAGFRLVRLDEANFDEAIRALYEAFRDHWGMAPETYEQYRARSLKVFQRPEVDPTISLAALEGDKVVGTAVCSRRTVDDAGMGWVNTLGVRRAWRSRGLGEALLRRAFDNFRALGLKRAGLNVDAESLTGATRLYTKVGMRTALSYLTYELELRDGDDLIVRELRS